MRKYILLSIFCTVVLSANAKHITGGEIIYSYIGPGDINTKIYKITLRLFRDNLSIDGAEMPPLVSLGVFNNDNNLRLGDYLSIKKTENEIGIGIVSKPSCLVNPPLFNYSMGIYDTIISLPDNILGYTITYQTCCRVDGISSVGGAPNVGATYTGNIPGIQDLQLENDNSALFETGISVVCQNKRFLLDFSATDPDQDSLVYSLVDAYNGGGATGAAYSTPQSPPYGSVPYSNPFSGPFPLSSTASINTSTGIISGIAPEAGKYIISALVTSYRNGRMITTHRKDFIVTVAPCDFANSELKPVYTSCDGFTANFRNENNSALNLTFDWDFGDPASGTNNTSTSETPTHTYMVAGDYKLRLIVNNNTPCADTATAIVKVYPGFFPAFAPVESQCKNTPVQFADATTANFGKPSYWRWDFGDQKNNADTSLLEKPSYTYKEAGRYNASFIVETDKGCRDTLYPVVDIIDKPVFFITNDTLICTIDTLQLKSNVNNGTIKWTPNYMISDVNSYNPLISPDKTTTYYANYEDKFKCTNVDSINVRSVSEVTLAPINDTTICRTDTAQLIANTDALYFRWTPTNKMIDSKVKSPFIIPTDPTTTYHIKALISEKCFKDQDINVRTIPYPVAKASGVGEICIGSSSQLTSSGGSIYKWTPATYLNNANIPNPIAQSPNISVNYKVEVRDTFGCPKPRYADFRVNVLRVVADAGPSDTSIVLNQPLQLQATGSTNYEWTPPTSLEKTDISNPIATPTNNITYKVKVSNNIGCFDMDTINVKVFFLPSDLYVPTAFTPNNDDKNNIFKPIALGIQQLNYFNIYNRLGELVFTTKKLGTGWDGKYRGKDQEAGNYVWELKAITYERKPIYRKGNVILIR